jgi:MSHA biogenesis protein MshP
MKQRGFSLITAVFLIAVLGGIALVIGRVSTMQHQSSALDEEGAMAYQAARAGIEWGVYQALAATPLSCAASTSFAQALTVPTTPSGTVDYTVVVECAHVAATEGLKTIDMYTITATANNATGGDFAVERRLTATVSK